MHLCVHLIRIFLKQLSTIFSIVAIPSGEIAMLKFQLILNGRALNYASVGWRGVPPLQLCFRFHSYCSGRSEYNPGNARWSRLGHLSISDDYGLYQDIGINGRFLQLFTRHPLDIHIWLWYPEGIS